MVQAYGEAVGSAGHMPCMTKVFERKFLFQSQKLAVVQWAFARNADEVLPYQTAREGEREGAAGEEECKT